jgi:benzoyl-CoA reductase/2-hydroxyglutaryl-CoA dehydratase subunit BcrC/BadD/HgdB
MAERVIELCKEYRVDGLVFQITKTCRSTSNREMELLDMVSSTLDLPAVVMEGDQTDRSYYHMNDMFAQVEALLGAIDARGRHKRR